MHVFLAGQAATRELLQRYRTEAHVEILNLLGINLFYTDALGDTITVVTRKSDKHKRDWIMTGDIRVRFPSTRVASTVHEQQRKHHNTKDTPSARAHRASMAHNHLNMPQCGDIARRLFT